MDIAVTFESLDDAYAPPALQAIQVNVIFDPSLVRRLAYAKLRLDRLEQDRASRDLSALMSARVEFALASRALADHLIAQQFPVAPGPDCSGSFPA
ncbi:hypothetical protein [Modicisalibacter xianhensis]|uniref:Uncharacterized protein n=1 Tax=Modicisalibacter xianhensis TaxID=442341 RepID=A0A1I3ANZ2_9GAMM|nr:hypothetical protein [Halomonas xianhensis]SFH51506.1 hypothetical protein SAMN04487959_10541 [Halomonas xianhensis]